MNGSRKVSWFAVAVVALVGAMTVLAHAASAASADEAAIRAQGKSFEKRLVG